MAAAPAARPPTSRTRRVFRAVGLTIMLPILLGIIVLFVIAATPWGNDRALELLVSQANKRITGKVSIGTLRGNLFSNATIGDLRVVDSIGQPFFTARRARVRFSLWSALRGRIVIRSAELDTAEVRLDKRPGSRWNFQALMRPSTTPKDTSRHSPPPEIADVTIRHGRFLWRRPWYPDSTLSPAARDSAIAQALALSTRRRTERVPGGFQRVLDYHDIDAHLPTVRLPRRGYPLAVEIGKLAMLAEPYRPPAIDIRSLAGTLYANKDSLWWRGARMVMPASHVSGDGTIGFHRIGFWLDLRGTPVAFSDLKWLNPTAPIEPGSGGTLRYTMHVRTDTSTFAVTEANVHYGDASVIGQATIAFAKNASGKRDLLIRNADLAVAHLTTDIIHELAPSLPLRRRGTLDGHLAVSGQPRALQVNADVRFDDVISGLSHVTARGGLGFEHGVRVRDLVLGLRPLRLASVRGAGIRLPLGGTMSGDATVSGTPSEGWSVRGDLTHVDRGERSRVAGRGTYQTAGGRIDADATLEPLSLVTAGRFAPKAELRGAVTGRVHAEGTSRDLRFAGVLRSTDGGGSIDARGTVALRGSRSRYDIRAALDALDARRFSGRAPRTLLSGTISARGTGTSPATANVTLDADLARSSYDTFSVEYLRGRIAAAAGVLRVDTLDALSNGVKAAAMGSFGLTGTRSGTLHFSASVDSLQSIRPWLGMNDTGVVEATGWRQQARLVSARADSAKRADAVRIERIALGLPEGVSLAVDSLPPIPRDSLAGSLAVTGVLHGNVKELGIDAALRGSGLVMRGYVARGLAATVSSADIRSDSTPIAFRAAADSVEAAGYAFERVEADGRFRQKEKHVAANVVVRQDSLVSYAALGDYRQPSAGVHVIRVDSLRATFDTLVWRLSHAAMVQLDHGSAVIDSLDFRSSTSGRFFANGVIPKLTPIRLDIAAENVRVATVLRAMQSDAIADGAIGVRARVSGTRGAPAMTGFATLRNARYRNTRAPDVDLVLDYRNRLVAIDATATDSAGRRVLTGKATLPYDLAFTGVTGSRRIEAALVADVVFDSLNVAALPIPSHTIDDLHGMLGADAHLRGTWRAPHWTGRGALRDGGFYYAETGMMVADATADLSFANDTLRLDSLVARVGGPLRAWGFVDLTDIGHPLVNFSARGTNLRLMDQRRGLVEADAELFAVGPLDALWVTGRGEMLGGFLALKQFRKDLLRVKAPGDLSFLTVLDTTTPASENTRLKLARAEKKRVAIIADLAMVVDRGNYYRNRPDANTEYFTGQGEVLRIKLDQRTDDQWAVGFARIGGGEAYFRTRPFTPARGSLTFGAYSNAPGIVQQVGERKIWEPYRGWFPLQLFTGGTSKAPSVGLESGTLFPIRGRELNSYLTLGRASTSLTQQAGSSLAGSESWSGQLSGESGALAHRQQSATALGVVLHDIGTGSTKEYGLDAFSVSPADVPTELVFGKTGGVRGALIEGGRYLTTDRYVAGELRMTTAIPGFRIVQRFGTSYRIDAGIEPRFLFRAPDELGITHPTIRTGVFGLFLTRLWDF